jgi:hypothetical protein
MSMSEMVGTQGAYRQTWRKGSPRSLLQALISKNTKASEKEIHQKFWLEIEDDKELLRACVEYWLDHNYRSLIQGVERSSVKQTAERAKERAENVAAATSKLKARIEFEAKRVLLDWIMPNNKKLADCTGAECRQFGGWLTALGKKLPANRTVSQVFNEEQLQKIFQSPR